MYNFIEGKNPFHNGDINRTYNRILKGEFEFSSDQIRWVNGRPSVSKEAKDLISQLLKTNPVERPTFDQILQHPFFTNPTDAVPYYCLPHSLPTTVLDTPVSPEYAKLLQERAKATIQDTILAQTYIKVNTWMALERYGIGYRLSDGTYGQLLPDKSLMFIIDGLVCYKSQDQDIEVFSQDVPESLRKKNKMLKWFKSEIRKEETNAETQLKTAPWFKTFGFKS